MRLEDAVPVISNWFATVHGASLKLPNGWFGRPYDNFHQLNSVKVKDDVMVILFDEHQTIVMSEPLDVRVESNSLALISSSKIVWRWVEYGSTRSHEEVFASGAVEFLTPLEPDPFFRTP